MVEFSSWRSTGRNHSDRRQRPLPRIIEPALGRVDRQVPSGERWIYEIKFDGYRRAWLSNRAWRTVLPRCTEEDFAGYRRQRARSNRKQKMWATGSKMPMQTAGGRSTCYLRGAVDVANVERHVNATHLTEAEHV